MNIILTSIKRALLTLVFISISFTAFGQIEHYIGLDLASTAAANISDSKGFVVEPVYILEFNSPFYIKTGIGYSHFEKDSFYINMETITQGYFGKIGGGIANRYSEFLHAYLGANFIFSNFTDNYTFTIPGNYFGDYNGNYTKSNQFALGVEPSIELALKIHNTIYFHFGLHFTILVVEPDNSSYPNYYIPGIGIVNNTDLNASINMGLLFKLGSKSY